MFETISNIIKIISEIAGYISDYDGARAALVPVIIWLWEKLKESFLTKLGEKKILYF